MLISIREFATGVQSKEEIVWENGLEKAKTTSVTVWPEKNLSLPCKHVPAWVFLKLIFFLGVCIFSANYSNRKLNCPLCLPSSLFSSNRHRAVTFFPSFYFSWKGSKPLHAWQFKSVSKAKVLGGITKSRLGKGDIKPALGSKFFQCPGDKALGGTLLIIHTVGIK